jgi:hypothetical protein
VVCYLHMADGIKVLPAVYHWLIVESSKALLRSGTSSVL